MDQDSETFRMNDASVVITEAIDKSMTATSGSWSLSPVPPSKIEEIQVSFFQPLQIEECRSQWRPMVCGVGIVDRRCDQIPVGIRVVRRWPDAGLSNMSWKKRYDDCVNHDHTAKAICATLPI